MHHNELVFLISWPSTPQIEPNRFTGGLDPLEGTIKLKGKQAACLVTRHRILNISVLCLIEGNWSMSTYEGPEP